jgi:hypothetical protein
MASSTPRSDRPEKKKKTGRRPRDQTFRKSDVVRAYRAAVDAGVKNPIVRIDTVNRQITIIGGAPTDDDPVNEWDEVTATAPATKSATGRKGAPK